MFYRKKNGEKVHIANPHRPMNFSGGGTVPLLPNTPKKHWDEDTVLSHLQPGSLVVPTSVAKKHMHDYKGKVNGPIVKDRDDLIRAIVMPHEIVVAKPHAKRVEAFLRRRGVRLPLGK
jgi:hypothetical protein